MLFLRNTDKRLFWFEDNGQFSISQFVVDLLKELFFVLEVVSLFLVNEDFEQLSAVESDSDSFSENSSWKKHVFQESVVDSGQGSVLRDLLLVVGLLVDDGSLGEHQTQLRSLFGQESDHLLDLRPVSDVVRIRNEDD